MQEKLPTTNVASLTQNFSNLRKRKRVELYYASPSEYPISLIYSQCEWRIAYVEEDRALMEGVYASRAMRAAVGRIVGEKKPRVTLEQFFHRQTTLQLQ